MNQNNKRFILENILESYRIHKTYAPFKNKYKLNKKIMIEKILREIDSLWNKFQQVEKVIRFLESFLCNHIHDFLIKRKTMDKDTFSRDASIDSKISQKENKEKTIDFGVDISFDGQKERLKKEIEERKKMTMVIPLEEKFENEENRENVQEKNDIDNLDNEMNHPNMMAMQHLQQQQNHLHQNMPPVSYNQPHTQPHTQPQITFGNNQNHNNPAQFNSQSSFNPQQQFNHPQQFNQPQSNFNQTQFNNQPQMPFNPNMNYHTTQNQTNINPFSNNVHSQNIAPSQSQSQPQNRMMKKSSEPILENHQNIINTPPIANPVPQKKQEVSNNDRGIIHIDSRERDFKEFVKSNPFAIYMNSSITCLICIRDISVHTNFNDPYLLVQIAESPKGVFENQMNREIHFKVFKTECNSSVSYYKNLDMETMIRLRDISKITFQIIRPNGKLLYSGYLDKLDITTKSKEQIQTYLENTNTLTTYTSKIQLIDLDTKDLYTLQEDDTVILFEEDCDKGDEYKIIYIDRKDGKVLMECLEQPTLVHYNKLLINKYQISITLEII